MCYYIAAYEVHNCLSKNKFVDIHYVQIRDEGKQAKTA
jgi:hypothetical protein